MNRFIHLLALGGAVAMTAASPAFAHAKLVKSDPAGNATLAKAPAKITLTFNERLVPAFSKFDLVMPEHDGMKVPVKTAVSADGKQIIGTPASRLAKGDYKIAWTAAGSDGHKMTGAVSFKIG